MLPPGLHSQQAGTILPTLMLISPVRQPGWRRFAVSEKRGRTYDKEFLLHSEKTHCPSSLRNLRRTRHLSLAIKVPPAA
jgi:hypothetical protein